MNKNELKAIMAKHGDRQEDLAAYLGKSIMTISAKINGETDFKRTEIENIALRYSLTADDIQRIFFARTVADKKATNP